MFDVTLIRANVPPCHEAGGKMTSDVSDWAREVDGVSAADESSSESSSAAGAFLYDILRVGEAVCESSGEIRE